MVTKSLPTQLPSATFKTYVVADVGLAIGFRIVGSLKAVVGDQEIVAPGGNAEHHVNCMLGRQVVLIPTASEHAPDVFKLLA